MTAGLDTAGVEAARDNLEQRDRAGKDKRLTAAEAVRRYVPDGAVIGVGGTNHARTPMALLIEVLRQGRTGLTMTRPLSCFEAELMLATGMADRVMTSWVGIGHGWAWRRCSATSSRPARRRSRSGAISASACATRPVPWASPSCRR